jgi:hypothetical protein
VHETTFPLYIQSDQKYEIKSELMIDSSLQYGMQEGTLFFVYHDERQMLYQHHFMANNMQKVAIATDKTMKGIDLSWIAGDYLHFIKD